MKKLLAAVLLCVSAFSLKASVDGYFMLSVFSPGQLPVPMTHIYGGRLSFLYGECQELFGIDFGGVGRVREHMCGLQAGLGHIVGTDARGLQLGLVEMAESELYGCQIGFWNDVAGKMQGAQLGVFGDASSFAGVQFDVVNLTRESSGIQLGIYNQGFNFSGLQFGVVNCTATLKGCQIGLVNVSYWHEWPCLPFVNVRW